MRALLRILFVVPTGFVLACLAAGAFLVLAAIGFGPDQAYVTTYRADTIMLVIGVSVLAGAIAAVPAGIAILAAEVFAWRSVFFYILLGGGIGLGLHLFSPSGPDVLATANAQLLLATGCVGGFVYWLVAGNSAGLGIADSPARP